MTILTSIEKWTISELMVRFKVIKVHWEPHSESEWYLQYNGGTVFYACDKVCATRKEDPQLVGKEIEAHIDIDVEESICSTKKEKSFSYKDGWVEVTGIVEDNIKYLTCPLDTEAGTITYKLNSIFPVEISDLPKNINIGDWITIRGEASIKLPTNRLK